MQGGSSAGAAPHRIDVHHHIVPPRYRAEAEGAVVAQGGGDPAVLVDILGWTPEKSIETMDKNGIATALGSVSSPGIWFGDAKAARDLAHACNEYGAELGRKYPGRFGSFASLPLPDPDGSLKEIEHAFDTLGADGICLLTSYGDKWLGDDLFVPVFAELNRRKAVVYVHPTAPNCCKQVLPGIIPALVEFPTDTRTIITLLFAGRFQQFPDVKFIFSHGGGTITVLASRIQGLASRQPRLIEKVPHGVHYELRRLYYEIASFANPVSMAALRTLVPLESILYGSDFPYVPPAASVSGLAGCGLTPGEARAIDRDNALRLMPGLVTAR
jgi:predicted TIM-barrel fold metal-dependent hydrolase